jgi:hypothetical protein
VIKEHPTFLAQRVQVLVPGPCDPVHHIVPLLDGNDEWGIWADPVVTVDVVGEAVQSLERIPLASPGSEPNRPKFPACASPQSWVVEPMTGEVARSSAMIAAAPRKKVNELTAMRATRIGMNSGTRMAAVGRAPRPGHDGPAEEPTPHGRIPTSDDGAPVPPRPSSRSQYRSSLVYGSPMRDVALGIVAVVVGLLFCLRGYLMMRVIIPIWGAFAGFVLGAGAVASITGEGFLASVAAWISGALVALVFGLLAYLYYEVSVFVGVTAIGFMLATTAMVALNVRWTWVIVLVGVLVGGALGVVAIVGNLPMLLLTVLTAFGGSSAAVGGAMLLAGAVDAEDFTEADVVTLVEDRPAWWILYVVLAVVGLVMQLRVIRRVEATARAEWERSGGRQLRKGRAD